MKDYYQILGIPENASQDEIKGAFRRLAFQHHPDKNPGNERKAEERFKEINEAYGILGSKTKRSEYDAFRSGRVAGAGFDRYYQSTGYNQEDIFRNAFSNRDMFDELNRMFAQSGLRFDEDFLNRVFFSGRGARFQFFSSPGNIRQNYQNYRTSSAQTDQPLMRKPGFIERTISKVTSKLGKYIIKKAFGIDLDLPLKGEDISHKFTISSQEAMLGCKKQVRYKRDKEKKTIEVTVPAGIASGHRIKLSGMGGKGLEPGDLYLQVRVK